MNIFIGNLPKEVVESELQKLFTPFGNVTRVKIIRDSYTGESKGYGFIEMPGQTEGLKAVSQLNSKDVKGRKIVVNEARPRAGMNSSRTGSGNNNKGNW